MRRSQSSGQADPQSGQQSCQQQDPALRDRKSGDDRQRIQPKERNGNKLFILNKNDPMYAKYTAFQGDDPTRIYLIMHGQKEFFKVYCPPGLPETIRREDSTLNQLVPGRLMTSSMTNLGTTWPTVDHHAGLLTGVDGNSPPQRSRP